MALGRAVRRALRCVALAAQLATCAALGGSAPLTGARAAVIVGIDLGTTNSAVARLVDGQPTVIHNAAGKPTTPSVVAFTPSGVLVGEVAADQASSNVQNTLYSVKRFIGRSPKQTSQDARAVGFTVVAQGDEVTFSCPAAPENLAPEEVSAAVLSQLLADAEQAIGAPVQSAVITVPAYFDERQRLATRAAARIAGLQEVHLLSEPVAACLAYGFSGATGKVLVFDLGAGTFDVSVLSLSTNGEIEVTATSGDAHLGGEDFDNLLVGWLSEQAASRGHALSSNRTAMRIVREAAEAAKIQLSVLKSVTVQLPSSEPGKVLEVELTRGQLEELCEPLLRRLKTPLYEVALSAGVSLPGEQEEKSMKKPKKKERRAKEAMRPIGTQKGLPIGEPVDEIVMVGGASKMAAVRKLVTNLFGVHPRRTVDPMCAVALGAALQAGILSGELQGVRVMHSWQADLGRLLSRMNIEESEDLPDSGDSSDSWLDETLAELGFDEDTVIFSDDLSS